MYSSFFCSFFKSCKKEDNNNFTLLSAVKRVDSIFPISIFGFGLNFSYLLIEYFEFNFLRRILFNILKPSSSFSGFS